MVGLASNGEAADRHKTRLLEELEEVLRKAKRREILKRLDVFDGGAGVDYRRREERLRLEREVELAKSRRHPGF